VTGVAANRTLKYSPEPIVTIVRAFAATAILACAAPGFAGPAQADQILEGVYNYTETDGRTGIWTIYPSCVPVVGDLRVNLELPVACRLHVAGSTGISGGDAVLRGGMWAFETTKRQGMKCPDGGWAPTTETVKFDDITMTGTRSIFHNAVCGLQPGQIDIPFALSFKEPLPIPVDRYPLICEPGGLRRCF
jgi:hypothetical protein